MFFITDVIAAGKRLAASLNHLSDTLEKIDAGVRERVGLDKEPAPATVQANGRKRLTTK